MKAPLAIVSAMREELAALHDALDAERVETIAGREFHHGVLDGHAVVLVLSGIGKVAAATTATLLASEFAPRALIFTGVAGGLADAARVGDVVVARELLQHDMDASPLCPRYEVPFTGRARFPADAALSELLVAAARHCLQRRTEWIDARHLAAFGLADPRVHEGLVVSGDRFVSTQAESAELRERLPDALAVEMEGAALAQVCADLGRPFAVLRTISDRADDNAHVDFARFIEEVASHFSAAIVREALARMA